MRSIKEIYVIGYGPSSSHTMGPAKAAEYILNKYPNLKNVEVTLFGSLALTGKGHLTDYIIDLKLKDVPHKIIFDETTHTEHPNTMTFKVTTNDDQIVIEKILSIGGGTIVTENDSASQKDVYPHRYMKDILEYCKENYITLAQYVRRFEDPDILDYIKKCFYAMMAASVRGIETEGYLPGKLHLKRKAPEMFKVLEREKKENPEKARTDFDLIMTISSLAASEENASGGQIVIAPTCGSCGVMPGALAYLEAKGVDLETIFNGMLVGGLIGIICKTNASVSGAEAGCQAEIGVACSMSAGVIAYCQGMDNRKIAQAAEIALEHSLGLTCDPVLGYVQVPCIERCAMFALKAKSAVKLAKLIPVDTTIISFDDSVKTMYQTGKDLQAGYRETSEKGLANLIK